MIPDGVNCTVNEAFPVNGEDHRFQVRVCEHDLAEEDGWTHKLEVYDRQYLDIDGYVVHSIAAGNSWSEAFATAGQFIDLALAKPGECIFV